MPAMPAAPTTPVAPVLASRPIRRILRLEGLAHLLLAVAAYDWTTAHLPGAWGWGTFAAAFLAPDLAMLGYLRSPRHGTIAYNVAHSDVLPIALLAVGVAMAQPVAVSAALVWLAHIAFDRMLGYGLKGRAFGETHLGMLGRRAA